MAPQRASIRKFLEVTGIENADVASYFLERNDENISQSINSYFSNPRLVDEVERKINRRKKNQKSSVSKQLQTLFNKYKESEPDATGKNYIGVDGTMQYIEDLGYEPEDEVVLCIAEFLESKSVGDFKEESFLKNWGDVDCNTIEEMSEYIETTLKPKLHSNQQYFTKIYQYTFRFILGIGEKTVSLDIAKDYWNLLVPHEYKKELETFVNFLDQKSHSQITHDQWNMLIPFLKFYHSDPQLKSYDESQSWPLLMDDFYEFLQDK